MKGLQNVIVASIIVLLLTVIVSFVQAGRSGMYPLTHIGVQLCYSNTSYIESVLVSHCPISIYHITWYLYRIVVSILVSHHPISVSIQHRCTLYIYFSNLEGLASKMQHMLSAPSVKSENSLQLLIALPIP